MINDDDDDDDGGDDALMHTRVQELTISFSLTCRNDRRGRAPSEEGFGVEDHA